MNLQGIIDTLRDLLIKPEARFIRLGDDFPPVAITTDAAGAEQLVVPYQAADWLEKRRDRLADSPRRREGTSTHHEAASFCELVNRQKSAHSTIWADLPHVCFIAILDYNPAGGDPKAAAWGKHRAIYTCPKSPAWQAWCARDGKAMPQEDFADFIEEHLEEMASGKDEKGREYPDPAAVLELARDLKVNTEGRFARKIDPTTGEASLECKTENTYNSTPIPRAFLLGLAVFEGGKTYGVEARLRLKVQDGRAWFSFTLHRRAEFERAAFNDVRTAVAESTKLPVFSGTPEA